MWVIIHATYWQLYSSRLTIVTQFFDLWRWACWCNFHVVLWCKLPAHLAKFFICGVCLVINGSCIEYISVTPLSELKVFCLIIEFTYFLPGLVKMIWVFYAVQYLRTASVFTTFAIVVIAVCNYIVVTNLCSIVFKSCWILISRFCSVNMSLFDRTIIIFIWNWS